MPGAEQHARRPRAEIAVTPVSEQGFIEHGDQYPATPAQPRPARRTGLRGCTAAGRPARAVGPEGEDPVHGAGQRGDNGRAGVRVIRAYRQADVPC
jgi:hypothetical protein